MGIVKEINQQELQEKKDYLQEIEYMSGNSS